MQALWSGFGQPPRGPDAKNLVREIRIEEAINSLFRCNDQITRYDTVVMRAPSTRVGICMFR